MVVYVPQEWVNGPGGGTPRSAERLNYTESGLEAVSVRVDAMDGVSAIGDIGAGITVTAGGGNGCVKMITLSEDAALGFNVSNAAVVASLEFVITQDSTGGWVITWPDTVVWPAGTAPTLSAAPGAVDRVVLATYDGGTTWYGDLVGLGYA